MVKYLKKIGVLSLLFSVAINNNFKAMDCNSGEMSEINLFNFKSTPIVRKEKHLEDCARIGDFEDRKQLKEWLSTFFPYEAVGRFLQVQRLSKIGVSGDYIQICSSPRIFVSVSEVLDLMVSLVASKEAKEFFKSKDKEVVINLDDVVKSFPTMKMSKVPALFGEMHKEVDRISSELISVPIMKIENFFFTKLTFDKLDNDFTFIVALIKNRPVIFIKYRNICLSNLVRKQEQKVSNNINFSYSDKVIEHDGKEFKSFFIDRNFHVFGVKKPFSFENIIVEV